MYIKVIHNFFFITFYNNLYHNYNCQPIFWTNIYHTADNLIILPIIWDGFLYIYGWKAHSCHRCWRWKSFVCLFCPFCWLESHPMPTQLTIFISWQLFFLSLVSFNIEITAIAIIFLFSGSKRQAVSLRFSNVFGSHMVMQRERKNNIWGFADKSAVGANVTLTVTYEGISEMYHTKILDCTLLYSHWLTTFLMKILATWKCLLCQFQSQTQTASGL